MVAQIDKEYFACSKTKSLVRLLSYAFFEGRPLTTKGRWINPLVFAIYQLAKLMPQMQRVESPVFILGTGRSGTTLLGTLLSMHKDVGYLNEPKALWHSLYPHEDLIGSYTFNSACYRLDAKNVTDEMITHAHKIYGAYLRTIGAKRVVDKYPELLYRIEFVKRIFPDARFVLIARNGYDTCASIEKWSQRKGVPHGDGIADWWGADSRKWRLLVDQILVDYPGLGDSVSKILQYKDHTHRALVEWILSMAQGMDMVREYPEDFLLMRYEELTSAPELELPKLTAFLELEDDAKMMEYARSIVRPTVTHKRINVPHELRPAFVKVMEDLGYED